MGSVIRYKIRNTLRKSDLLVDFITLIRRHRVRFSHNLKGRYYSFRYDAPVDPLRLINVDPTVVRSLHGSSTPFDNTTSRGCLVVGGDWDLDTRPLNEYRLYQSFIKHFCEGVPWEKTTLWKEVVENEAWTNYHAGSLEEFRERCNKLDTLYDKITSEGYLTQKELVERGDDPVRDEQRTLPTEMYEVTVDIGRDGEFIVASGRHRLTLSNVIELDSIPVRVRARHEEWQRTREQVYNGEQKYFDHPDVKRLKRIGDDHI